MRARAPYTPVKLYTDGLAGIEPGHYIVASAKTAYLVQQVRPSPTIRGRKYLACLRWPPAEIPRRRAGPRDLLVFPLEAPAVTRVYLEGGEIEADDGERFNFVFALHVKLDHGGSMYVYRCDDFGLQCSRYRASRDAQAELAFSVDGIDDETFPTLAEAVAALRKNVTAAASAGPPSAL